MPHKKEVTPPHVLAEDTHVDIRGRSPTPITMEYMLDRILTDLPMLSALHLPHRVCTFLILFFLVLILTFSFSFRMRPGALCVLGAVCFVNTKSLWLHALTVTVGVTAPAGCLLMTCRRFAITCWCLHRPLIHVHT